MRNGGFALVILVALSARVLAAGAVGSPYKYHHPAGSNGQSTSTSTQVRPGAILGHTALFREQSAGATQGWTKNPSSLPDKLETEAAVVNNGYLYVIGGLSDGTTPTSSVLYSRINSDGTLGTFESTTPLPYTLYRYLCGVVNNGYIYAIGGVAYGSTTSPGCTISSGCTTSSVLYAQIKSDGSLNEWEYNLTSLLEPLQLQGTVANNGYLYVIGGSTAPTAEFGDETASVEYAKFNSDGSLGPFSYAPDLPVPIYKTCPVADHGSIYLLGGETPTGEGETIGSVSSVWYATPAEDGSLSGWAAATQLPYTDAATAVVNSEGAIVMTGGDTTGTGGDTSCVIGGTFASPGTINWTYLPSLPKITSRQAGAAYNGYVYSIGGISPKDTNEVYYMSTTPESATASCPPIGRAAPAPGFGLKPPDGIPIE